MRTVFFVVHQGFTTRYLLRTDIFTRYKELGYRIVIVSPNSDDERFVSDYADDNVYFELFDSERINKIRSRFFYSLCVKIRGYLYPHDLDVSTLKDKEFTLKSTLKRATIKGRCLALLPIYCAKVLSRVALLRSLLICFERQFYRGSFHQHLFDKYQPSCLLIADLGTIDASNFIMYEAQKNRVPIFAIILSWDNLTSKGIGNIVPNYAVAWNETMVDELRTYHRLPDEHIIRGGIPHFDVYFRQGMLMGHDEFCECFDLAVTDKVLFYGTASPSNFKENIRIVELIIESIRKGRLERHTKVIIRPHPVYIIRKKEATQEEYKNLRALCNANKDIVRFSEPELKKINVGYDMPIRDMRIVGSLFKHADVLVTQFSTLMLEAAIFNTPIVNVAFDNFKDTEMKTVELKDRTHLKKVLQEGFTTIVEHEKDFVPAVNAYLADNSLLEKERRIIREREGGFNKGTAGRSIADSIHECVTRG